MNEYLSGFVLGLIQGLTEFLPVSSSGHLFLAESLGVGEPSLTTNLLLHLATLLAVCICYRKKIFDLLKHPLGKEMRFYLLACIPTGILAAILRYAVNQTVRFLPFCFLVTSVLLLLPTVLKPASGEDPLARRPVWKAIFVGGMQGIACLNGISRSGSTVVALRLCGFSAERSAETSFLLSIPVIVASAAVELVTAKGDFAFDRSMAIGMITAFVVGIAAIKIFEKILKKDKMWIFSIYTFLLSIAAFYLVFFKR